MNRVAKIVLLLVLFLVVPLIIGRGGTMILEAVDPPSPTAGLIEQLEHVRGQTRLLLLLIAGYYVLLVSTLVVLSVRRRKAKSA